MSKQANNQNKGSQAEQGNFDIEQRIQEIPHIVDELGSNPEKVSEFKCGDDQCVVYYVLGSTGVTLNYFFQLNGNLRGEKILLPPGEDYTNIPTLEQDRQSRIKKGVAIIKQHVKSETEK